MSYDVFSYAIMPIHQSILFSPSTPRANINPSTNIPHLLRILLRSLTSSLIELRPIILILLRSRRLNRIIGHRLNKQILSGSQHAHDLAARFPEL